MRIEAAFCDIHPGTRLVEAAIRLSLQPGVPEQKALHCTRPNCNRHYHYDYGYFPLDPGQEPEFGDLKTKPKCRLNHDLLYLLLTKVDGEVVYACFHPECVTTVPFAKDVVGAERA